MKISVIGCGYLGTVHAIAMASLGHEVIGIDLQHDRIEQLNQGKAPFYEPELQEHLSHVLEHGSLRFTTELGEVAGSSVHFVCVGTPQLEDSPQADLSALTRAFTNLAHYLSPGDVVVGKSTVPVGTAPILSEIISESGATLAWNPEFLREGQAFKDTLEPDRIVLGVDESPSGKRAVEILERVYEHILRSGTPLIVTDFSTAELAKGAANAFLATKVSFMNAMAEIADKSGANILDLANIMGRDTRIGNRYMSAGAGFGGGCLPKDIRAFGARALELGAPAAQQLLDVVDTVNIRQRSLVVEFSHEMLNGDVIGKKVAILGAAFKPHSDDIRDAPAIDIGLMLQVDGADVTVTDPEALSNAEAAHPNLQYEHDVLEACQDADLVILATEWPEYRGLNPAVLKGLVRAPRMLDARNALDSAAWKAEGWEYRGVGRR